MDRIGTQTAAERRREAQRQEVRNEILAAARKLVDERGPNALTIREVASAIGYSPGALYEYFGSKRDILEAMYFQGAQGLKGRTRQVVEAAGPNAQAIDRVAMAGRAYRSFALDHPDLYLLIFSVRHSPENLSPREDAPESDATFGSLIGMLEESLQRGEITGGSAEQLASSLWAFVHGFVMLEITGRLPNQPIGVTDKLFESGLTILGEGLRPRPNAIDQETTI